ncbi:hypothetical protein Nepgr_024643 [Nepenthes gracilis]|uniref:Uncharacterized protein n=1 Tax=Nepenthes gracilis TaxID=150966 RepID=A0AAD3Y094_NEPGR|nr:hypothetical protein Nepgr_024643 [Nepenthes gracilis]
MHRTSSNTRVSDEYLKYSSSSPSQSSARSSIDIINGSNSYLLPVYIPTSDAAKKARSRVRSAEIAVHVIPLVLVVCAVILWFFSYPGGMIKKGDLIVSRSERVKFASAVDIDGTQNSFLSHL